MKKKLFFYPALILMILLSISGCKRGENDPFLSLKSRDARIAGRWVLTSLSQTQIYVNNIDGDVVSETTTTTYENGNLATVLPSSDVINIPYSYEVTINKNGTYSEVTISDGVKTEKDGYWWWLNDSKNKTRIAFDDDNGSFLIDQLKDTDLILIYDSYIKSTLPDNIFEETTITSTSKFTKR